MKKKFKPGQAIVFEPKWAERKEKGVNPYVVKKNKLVIEQYPLLYGDVVHFLAYHDPAVGHCIVTTYKGKVVTMLHPEDFRKATMEEV